MVDNEAREEALFPERAGERLRAARIRAGLDLGDVATRTRIPLRSLEAIERGDVSGIASPTYAIGFAKSFARAIGEDGDTIARLMREELGQRQPEQRDHSDVEDFDPQRLPSNRLVWTAALIALLIFGGYAVWRGWVMRDPAPPPSVPEVANANRTRDIAPVATSAPEPRGQVVLTAKDTVWLRVYDAADKVLIEKEFAAGERFEVPADANNPMIRTGRAELIDVTIDGRKGPSLGPPDRTIKDVGISAAALAARAAEPANAAPAP